MCDRRRTPPLHADGLLAELHAFANCRRVAVRLGTGPQERRTCEAQPPAAKYVTDCGVASAPSAKAQKNLDTLPSLKAKQPDKEQAMSEFLGLKGNADSGKAVFRRTCVNCHRVFDEGFEYGPDMKGVATRLKDADDLWEEQLLNDPRFAKRIAQA